MKNNKAEASIQAKKGLLVLIAVCGIIIVIRWLMGAYR
jgi:hypothetical protein